MIPQEELSLIKNCQSGDLSSFSVLYDFYLDKIYRFIYYRVSHREVAEDLSSQVFLKAIKAISSADFTDRNFSAWLYKIAYNLIIDHYRSEKKDINIDDVINYFSGQDLLLEVDKNRKVELIKEAMNFLNAKQKNILIMRVWDELSYREISNITGDSEANCKVVFSRTVSKLKDNLPIEYLFVLLIFNILKTKF